jgi:hypothetical protein
MFLYAYVVQKKAPLEPLNTYPFSVLPTNPQELFYKTSLQPVIYTKSERYQSLIFVNRAFTRRILAFLT